MVIHCQSLSRVLFHHVTYKVSVFFIILKDIIGIVAVDIDQDVVGSCLLAHLMVLTTTVTTLVARWVRLMAENAGMYPVCQVCCFI